MRFIPVFIFPKYFLISVVIGIPFFPVGINGFCMPQPVVTDCLRKASIPFQHPTSSGITVILHADDFPIRHHLFHRPSNTVITVLKATDTPRRNDPVQIAALIILIPICIIRRICDFTQGAIPVTQCNAASRMIHHFYKSAAGIVYEMHTAADAGIHSFQFSFSVMRKHNSVIIRISLIKRLSLHIKICLISGIIRKYIHAFLHFQLFRPAWPRIKTSADIFAEYHFSAITQTDFFHTVFHIHQFQFIIVSPTPAHRMICV